MAIIKSIANPTAAHLDTIIESTEKLSRLHTRELWQWLPNKVKMKAEEELFFNDLFSAIKFQDTQGRTLTEEAKKQFKQHPENFDINQIDEASHKSWEHALNCFINYRIANRYLPFSMRLIRDFHDRECFEREQLEKYLRLPNEIDLTNEKNELADRLKVIYAEKAEIKKQLEEILSELDTKEKNSYPEKDNSDIFPDDLRKINTQSPIRRFPIMQPQSPQTEPINLSEDAERKPKIYTLDDINRRAAEMEKASEDFENFDEQDALEGEEVGTERRGRPKKEITLEKSAEKEPENTEPKKKDIFEQVLEPETAKALPTSEEILKIVYASLKRNPVGLRMSDLGYPKDVIISAIKSDVQKKYLKYSDGGTLQKSWINTGWNFPKGG